MKASFEEMVVKIASDVDKYDETELLGLAQLAWSACYGGPRARDAVRIDKGLKRLNAEDVDPFATETAFIRKRRKEAASAASECASIGLDDDGDASDLAASAFWTSKHDRELAFQQQKVQAKLVHAYSENCLLPEETTMFG